MAVMTAIAATALAVSAGATIYSANQQNKAGKANQQAAALDRQRMNLQAAREKRDAIKAARLAGAQTQQTAENQGASMSSSAAGGQGSIQSQLASNLSFLDRDMVLADAASVQIGYANKFQSKARTGDAIASVANSVFNNSDTLSKVWKGA